MPALPKSLRRTTALIAIAAAVYLAAACNNMKKTSSSPPSSPAPEHRVATPPQNNPRPIATTPPLRPGAILIHSNWSLQDIAKVSDAGDAISQLGYAPKDWYKATVPGTVLTSLVNDGVYPEPLYGENNRPDKIPESLCRTDYWYRTEFTIPQSFAGKHTWLNFDGINYTADVWINGKQAGAVKGAFARGIFDISEFVKPGEKAALAVRINRPPHPGNPVEQTVVLGTGRNGGDLMQDGPTFGCTVGWDWIPAIRDRDMGIWQQVSISTTGPVRIEDPSVSSDLPLPRTDSADLMLLTTVKNTTDEPQTGTLHASFDGGTFQIPVSLTPRETKEIKVTPQDAPQLHILNPKLWWPNTYGEPHLYTMHLSFDLNGVTSDQQNTNFGIRKITYQVPADQTLIPTSENLTVFVNGVPVMCKGGCWGMDEAMKRIPRDRLEAQVRFHALANYTMIRNWVGQSTSEDFYDMCDKYGIMIWDEMFQANASDGPQVGGVPRPDDTPEILALREQTIDMYLANVREKIVRYRKHPSIALWCGRNESFPAPAAVADGLTQMTAELDPARFYQANSGSGRGVQSGGPYGWRVPGAFYFPAATPPGAPAPTTAPAPTITQFAPGLAPGFNPPPATAPAPTTAPAALAAGGPGALGTAPGRGRGRGPGGFGAGRGGRGPEPFKTELGSVSIPSLEFIKAMMPPQDLSDLNDDWAEHDLLSGAQSNRQPGDAFPRQIAARYGYIAPGDLPDFTRKSQLAMYETYRAMYEGRFAKLFNPCVGVLTWMSNPSQPSFVWQLYSYDLEPLAALYGAKKACEPLHIQWNLNDNHIMLINTAAQPKENLHANIRIFNMDGTQKFEKNTFATAKPCAATDLNAIDFPADLSPVHFIKLELRDDQNHLISDNFYWRTTHTIAPSTGPIGFGAGGAAPPTPGRGSGAAAPGGGGGGGGGRGPAPATPLEDFSLLQTLPTASIDVQASRRDADGRLLLDVTLSNPTKTVALLTHVQLRNQRTNQRILPVFYSDNFISLLPGESKAITIEAAAADLGADRPLLALDGFNITTKPQPTNPIAIIPNTPALVPPKPTQ